MPKKNRKSLLERFKTELKFYQAILKDSRTPKSTKYFLGLAIAYALSPIDIIPDYIPLIGYWDDAIIIPALILIATRLIPKKLLEEVREAEYLKSISPMVTTVEKYADFTVFKLAGDVDLTTMPSIENIIAEHQDGLEQDIVFDFKAVTHIDTSTLAVLIYIINKLKQDHRRLGLIHCNQLVKDYVKVNKLESIIHVYDSINDVFKGASKLKSP